MHLGLLRRARAGETLLFKGLAAHLLRHGGILIRCI